MSDLITIERGVVAEAYDALDQAIDHLLDVSQDTIDYGSEKCGKTLEMLHVLQRSRAALNEAFEGKAEVAE